MHKNRMLTALISLTLLCIISRQAAYAQHAIELQSAEQENSTVMRALDTDKNGLISIKEAVANPQILAVFAKIDRNGDGNLDPQELAAARQAGSF